MDHDLVVREKITEKYLLEELDPELRDEYEGHFFDCPECARDIRAGSEFLEHSKNILAEPLESVAAGERASVRITGTAGWFAWFRPALAVPLLAVLLAVIGYQNFVTLPNLTQAVNEPQLLPAATVNLLTYGANAAPLVVHAGQGFLVDVIVPPGNRYAGYRVDLFDPAGRLTESMPISASADDTWPIRFSGIGRQSGTYKLKVHGLMASGQDLEVGSGSFELQIQK